MDWARAIERNSEALVGIVEALFTMLGLVGSATVSRIPQPLHNAVLRVLRPAESAMRRLIVIAARGPCGEAGSIARDAQEAYREGWELTSLVSALRSAEKFRKSEPQNIHAESSAHPYLWERSPGGGNVAITPALSRSCSAARWPCQCPAPQPQAPGPQARARGSATPGEATRALAGQAGEGAKPEVQIAAPAGPSARLSQESNSRS